MIVNINQIQNNNLAQSKCSEKEIENEIIKKQTILNQIEIFE